MQTGLILVSAFLICTHARAILPLPYPTEPTIADTNSALEGGKDPRQIQAYHELEEASATREMELPTFDDGPDTLGYKPNESFQVPTALRQRVEFWKRIYTEFTTSQAVLHDSVYPQIIYGVVDLEAVAPKATTSPRRRAKLIAERLKAEKKKIERALRFLDANQGTPDKIPVELFPIFTAFNGAGGQDRFLAAVDRIRSQIGQRDRIVKGFLSGGRYFNELVKVFRAKHLPEELTRLPLVESAFNLAARSKVGASGVWQFMLSTGKHYLRIDRAIDERNDPISAAWAAAELLRTNYETLGEWPLAITAYNHGREGMQRAVREVSSTDLSEIIARYKAPSFGFASSNFYSEFLAILEVERQYRQHFGRLLVDSPIQFEEFNVGDDVRFKELVQACRMRSDELAELNPALTDWVVSGRGFVPHGYQIKVPVGQAAACRSGYHSVAKVSRRVASRTVLAVRENHRHHLVVGGGIKRARLLLHPKRRKLHARRLASRRVIAS